MMEGGSVKFNSAGVFFDLTSRGSLSIKYKQGPHLDEGLDRRVFEKNVMVQSRFYGLSDGGPGDDTDGRIGNPFVNAEIRYWLLWSRIHWMKLYSRKETWRTSESDTDLLAEPLNTYQLPCATSCPWGLRVLPASYANFLHCKIRQ